ncbi:MAG: hypothetical protein ABIO24_11730 [Saprospiraceae bacterium]
MEYENNDLVNDPYQNQQQAINKKQMAELMGVSLSTLKRQLKTADLSVKRGLISPIKQTEIFQSLGWAEKDPNEPK